MCWLTKKNKCTSAIEGVVPKKKPDSKRKILQKKIYLLRISLARAIFLRYTRNGSIRVFGLLWILCSGRIGGAGRRRREMSPDQRTTNSAFFKWTPTGFVFPDIVFSWKMKKAPSLVKTPSSIFPNMVALYSIAFFGYNERNPFSAFFVRHVLAFHFHS